MAEKSQAKAKAEEAPRYFVCSRCSYHWKPRKADGIPRNCPSCRSTVWMKPFEMKSCARCGYEWGSTSEEPRRCPGCGTYHWNEAPQSYRCLRCEHTWTAKRAWPPKRCPKCRSVSWNTERKEVSPYKIKQEPRRPTAPVADAATAEKVISEYRKGITCTAIAVSMKVPFSAVFSIIRDAFPGGMIRI